jgi:hypothetical protein
MLYQDKLLTMMTMLSMLITLLLSMLLLLLLLLWLSNASLLFWLSRCTAVVNTRFQDEVRFMCLWCCND